MSGMPFPGPCNPCTMVVLPGIGEWRCSECQTLLINEDNHTKSFQIQWAAHVQKVLKEALEES